MTTSGIAPAPRGGATSVPGWTTLAENPLVLVKEYAFGPGRANALAVALPNRKMLITSPPAGIPDAELSALAEHGDVVALLANNGTHHMGLAPARRVFPNAVTYATARAGARIRDKAKEPGQLEPIEALQPLLGDAVSVLAVDGDKVGDVLVRVRTEQGTLLYVSDFIANMQSLPDNFIFRMIFKLTDSGPGLKVFQIFFKFFVADRAAARDFLVKEIEANPPAVLVPAHGDVVVQSNLAPTLVGMLRAAF
jgi:hypothetical protein